MDPVELTTPPCTPPVKFVEPNDSEPIAIVVVVMITPRSPTGVNVIVNVSDGLNAHARPHAINPNAAANPSTAFIFRFIVLASFAFLSYSISLPYQCPSNRHIINPAPAPQRKPFPLKSRRP